MTRLYHTPLLVVPKFEGQIDFLREGIIAQKQEMNYDYLA